MKTLMILINRNTKIFFKDKGLFFSALIAPLILLGLYALFLNNVFVESFQSAIPENVEVAKSLINGYVGGWELSSVLAVCCVTVAFIANMIMVQDKVDSINNDFGISPVKSSVISMSYFLSTAFITLLIVTVTLIVGLIYLAVVGWYLKFVDILFILLDMIIMTLFGTSLSSIVSSFLKSQGGMSAVGTIVSSIYGFICGAYYPISQFSTVIKNIVTCLPGTYGTSLFRNHFLGGVFDELQTSCGFPDTVKEKMMNGFDVNLYFFDHKVSILAMYLVVLLTSILCIGIFILICKYRTKKLK